MSTSTVSDRARYRSVVSLDGRAMTELASIAAFYSLKTRTRASHSAILRRAVDLLTGHVLALMDKPDSDVDVLLERQQIREARVLHEGAAGWSLDSRKARQPRIDMETEA